MSDSLSRAVPEATAEGLAIAWGLAVLALAANVAGYAFNLYERFAWFDRVLHAGTIFAIAFWLALIVFARALHPDQARSLLAVLLLASVGVAVGALWEVAEWGADLVLAGDVIKGKHDTIMDLIMDTAGAAVAAGLATRFLRPHSGD